VAGNRKQSRRKFIDCHDGLAAARSESRATRTEPIRNLTIKGLWRLEATGHEAQTSKQAKAQYSEIDPSIAGP
jgi:hypothetical protein